MKSKWDRLVIQLLDPKDPVYFKMETKREYMAATTKNLSEMPITELVKELRLQGIRRKAIDQSEEYEIATNLAESENE